MFMLNLKPAKMVGIQSEGMIMCVSEGEKVEILVPPPGAAVGDRVTCPDYQGIFSSPSTLKISDDFRQNCQFRHIVQFEFKFFSIKNEVKN